jgi:hypothetical protein
MYTKHFIGLTANQVSELIETFGDDCSDWNKASGTASVDFDGEEEAAEFEASYQFAE